jgi:hypothetical protein
LAKRTNTVCDACGQEGGVTPFVIEGDGRLARVDLCPEHAAPLMDLLNLKQSGATHHRPQPSDARSVRRSSSYRGMVTTMEDLEALVRSRSGPQGTG